ncbi:hypothetical protein CK220_19515 [Mesorhizobium sp. WSM3860]|nr:hypothetical protein CK220_19515 [Mesorhizobium sp. WSM3860]
MSARAVEFLDMWMAEHLPNVITDDPVAISDLVDELMAAAKGEGIRPKEFHEEVDSVFEVIFEAMQHRERGLADGDEAARDLLAGRLAQEAGVTREQAQDLIRRFGIDWEPLLREAHFLKEQR